MSSRDKKLLIYLIGFLFVAAAYFCAFRPLGEKRQALENENVTLQTRLNQLLSYVAKEEEYTSGMERMNKEMNIMINEYPSELKDENEIMDVVVLEEKTDTFVSTLSIAQPVSVPVEITNGTFDADAASRTTEVVNIADGYVLYDYGIALNVTTGYDGLKKLIKEITSETSRSISQVMVTFDSSNGLLSGSVGYESYYLFGQDKAYDPADIPSINHGTKNIFGAMTKPVN